MNEELYRKAAVLELEMAMLYGLEITMLGMADHKFKSIPYSFSSPLLAKTRTTLRKYFGVDRSVIVQLTNKLGITYSGKHPYYTTKNGTPINHPSAYGRKGWSTMTYHPSTRVITCNKNLFWAIASLIKTKNDNEIQRILENEKY